MTETARTSELSANEAVALAGFDIERGNLEAALLKLKRVVAEKEPPSESLAMIARIYAQLRLFDSARDYFERYLQAQPDALNEQFQLGMVHFDAGRLHDALETWKQTLQVMPTHPPALFYSGLALLQDGKPADAKRSLDILLQSAPPDNLYFLRAKEVLASMDTSGRPAGATASGADPNIPYRTEH
jgi:tetratricopeptide (TPR) repeat protein